MNLNARYAELTHKDLTSLRHKIDPKAYQRSTWITLFWCFIDVVLYITFMYGIFLFDSIIAKLICGFLAGTAVSAMFVLAHDSAHGALFKNKWLAEIIGTVYMLPALNSYRLWCFGHNRIHHGFTSFSPIDWIWRPLTINEYNNLNKFKQFFYRVERSFWGCGLHYIVKVWWSKMVLFMPDNLPQSKVWAIRLGKFIISIFVLAVTTIAYLHGGIIDVLCALILPFIVFNYIISLIVYVHHTHPNIPFFDEKAEWNHTIGVIFCTTVIHTNWFIDKFLTHHILIHTPHHADIRIPFYRLKLAFNSIKQYYGEYIHEYRLTWSILYYIFKSCKLYDYKKHIWYSFSLSNEASLTSTRIS